MPGHKVGYKGTPRDRFWRKVDVIDDDGSCWLWTGALGGPNFTRGVGHRADSGYGVFTVRKLRIPAHRFAYEEYVGEIAGGLFIDHVCRSTRCVRPSHLEPVTHQENIRRAVPFGTIGRGNRKKTHCPRGHAYTQDNLLGGNPSRICKACHRIKEMARRRAAGAAAGQGSRRRG